LGLPHLRPTMRGKHATSFGGDVEAGSISRRSRVLCLRSAGDRGRLHLRPRPVTVRLVQAEACKRRAPAISSTSAVGRLSRSARNRDARPTRSGSRRSSGTGGPPPLAIPLGGTCRSVGRNAGFRRAPGERRRRQATQPAPRPGRFSRLGSDGCWPIWANVASAGHPSRSLRRPPPRLADALRRGMGQPPPPRSRHGPPGDAAVDIWRAFNSAPLSSIADAISASFTYGG
jgi:hypothetical protein